MSEPLRVVHVGVIGNSPSGMAQVVNEYMTWSIPDVQQQAIVTTRGRRDPLAPVLLVRAMLLLTVRRVLRRVDTAVVHLSERGSFVREGIIAALAHLLGLRVVAHLHGATFEEFAARHPRLVAAVLRKADAVAALTFETERITARLAPFTPVTLVPNAVKVPTDERHDRANHFLFAGEVGERKGVDTLIAAWRALGSARAGWELHIAGPDRAGLIDAAGPLPGMTYHGPLTHERVLALAEMSRVAVLPFRQEALPMFLLESMARGNAPLSTPVGQVGPLIEGVGILVEPGDVAGLTTALSRFCEGDVDIARLAQGARARVAERYSSDSVRSVLVHLWARRPIRERSDRAS